MFSSLVPASVCPPSDSKQHQHHSSDALNAQCNQAYFEQLFPIRQHQPFAERCHNWLTPAPQLPNSPAMQHQGRLCTKLCPLVGTEDNTTPLALHRPQLCRDNAGFSRPHLLPLTSAEVAQAQPHGAARTRGRSAAALFGGTGYFHRFGHCRAREQHFCFPHP